MDQLEGIGMQIQKHLIIGLLAVLLILLVGCQLLPSAFTPLTTSPPATKTTPPPSPTVQEVLTVNFLDVGQADCAIIHSAGKTMIIDAGTNSVANSLVGTIKKMGIKRFDIAVGTHPHEDHVGGMDAVINQFEIGQIYMPKVTTTTNTFLDVLNAIKSKGLTVTTPIPGSQFNLGDAQLAVLAPNSQKYDDLNNYSIVLRLEYGSTSFLFTGDAQSISEQEMLAKGFDVKSDVLKVGHHGSSSSTTASFLKAVAPKYAVISVGAGNDYGHPHQETLNKLNSAGVKVYRTDLNGTVVFTSDGSSLLVKTAR